MPCFERFTRHQEARLYLSHFVQKRTPRCASVHSPGLGIKPPPIRARMLRCDAYGEMVYLTMLPNEVHVRTLYIFETSSDSSTVRGGKISGMTEASEVFPHPGAPINRIGCHPAARLCMRECPLLDPYHAEGIGSF